MGQLVVNGSIDMTVNVGFYPLTPPYVFTASAVTIQLQQLEEELGFQLFLRTRSGIHATEAGEIVIESAKRIAGELTTLEERIASLKGVSAGTIRLGVVSTGKYFAPRIMAAFNRLYPGVQMTLIAANRTEIIEKLRNFEIDVALMGRPPKDFSVRTTLFGDHPLVFIAAPDHALAGKLDITKEEIAQQKFIVRERGSGTRSSFEFFMGEVAEGLTFTPTEMDSNETIKQAVAAGLGIAFISGHTIEQELAGGKLRILDVTGTPIKRHWFLVRSANRLATPAIEAFQQFMATNGMALLPVIGKTYSTPDAIPAGLE